MLTNVDSVLSSEVSVSLHSRATNYHADHKPLLEFNEHESPLSRRSELVGSLSFFAHVLPASAVVNPGWEVKNDIMDPFRESARQGEAA